MTETFYATVVVAMTAATKNALEAGDKTRLGSVLRNAMADKGGAYIVDHLPEVHGSERTRQLALALGKSIVDSMEDNRSITNTVAGVGVAMVGGGIFAATKREQARSLIDDYLTVLREYLDTVRSGSPTLDIVDRLDAAMERLEEGWSDKRRIKFSLSKRQSAQLIDLSVECTRKLADLPSQEAAEEGTVVVLRRQLDAHSRLLSRPA